MTDLDALLAAIADRPDDDTPQLVYADWCDDHDEPARAELIRVMCRRTRLSGAEAEGKNGATYHEARLWREHQRGRTGA